MAEAETMNWQDDISRIDERYTRDMRRLKRRIRDTQTEDYLERGILGITGSVELLEEFRALGRNVSEHAGQPIIVVERTERSRRTDETVVDRANGGFIDGGLSVKLSPPLSRSSGDDEVFTSVAIRIPVLAPVVSSVGENVYLNEDTSLHRDPQILVAAISLRKNDGMDLERDYECTLRRYPLIGRAAIYAHPHFSQGIDTVMAALENARG